MTFHGTTARHRVVCLRDGMNSAISVKLQLLMLSCLIEICAMRRLWCDPRHVHGVYAVAAPYRGAVTLPSVAYNIPESRQYDSERAGGATPRFLSQLPQLKAAMRNSVYLSSKEAMWNAPAHESVEEIVSRMAYHDIARYVMEHNWFHLFPFMLMAKDAPLPHVVYEDFMQCKTFSSLQCPPEEQFALEPGLLRSLLCYASHAVLIDEHYFSSVEALFRTIEQQQRVGSEVMSSWVLCLVSAGKVRRALQAVVQMSDDRLRFDPVTFALMMHPHADPADSNGPLALSGGRGFILQQRLQHRMETAHQTSTVAIHAMFTHYILTMQHALKWDVLRQALEMGITVSERTLTLALEVFSKERGRRCGPKTMKALLRALVVSGQATDLVLVLFCCRRNELLPEFRDLPAAEFSEADIAFVVSGMRNRARGDKRFALVEPLVTVLMEESDPRKLDVVIRELVSSDLRMPSFSTSPLAGMPQSTTLVGKVSALASTHTDPTDTLMHERPSAVDSVAEVSSVDTLESVASNPVRGELLTLLEGALLNRVVKPKKKKARRTKKMPEREADADPPLVFSSPIEGRRTVESLRSDLNSDVRSLSIALTAYEKEQRREEERMGRIPSAWVNPDW